MASLANNLDRFDAARALLLNLQYQARRPALKGEMNVATMALAMDASLADPLTRADTMHFLSAYLGRCLSGSIPDIGSWDPPL